MLERLEKKVPYRRSSRKLVLKDTTAREHAFLYLAEILKSVVALSCHCKKSNTLHVLSFGSFFIDSALCKYCIEFDEYSSDWAANKYLGYTSTLKRSDPPKCQPSQHLPEMKCLEHKHMLATCRDLCQGFPSWCKRVIHAAHSGRATEPLRGYVCYHSLDRSLQCLLSSVSFFKCILCPHTTADCHKWHRFCARCRINQKKFAE